MLTLFKVKNNYNNKFFYSAYSVPGNILVYCHVFTHLILTTALRGKKLLYPHFMGEETDSERLNNFSGRSSRTGG